MGDGWGRFEGVSVRLYEKSSGDPCEVCTCLIEGEGGLGAGESTERLLLDRR